MNVAMLVAVETYGAPDIKPVIYAKADATDFSTALAEAGFDPVDQVVLIDSAATKSVIESNLRRTIAGLHDDDVFFLYYAGHGFSKNGSNYLTCHDTQRSDLPGTSISLQQVFQQLNAAPCKKIAMFLDSCESGLLATEAMRSLYGDLTEDELKEFFKSSEHCVCFAACKTGQESHASRKVKHGAWTYHLIEAFSGNAPTALAQGSILSAISLQNYLKKAVPRTLRESFTAKIDQTPWMYGASTGDFLLADLSEVLARRAAAANPHAGQIKEVAFIDEEVSRVKSLSGFKKTHRVPDACNSTTESFVSRLAEPELEKDLSDLSAALRTRLKFKRLDLNVTHPGDGTGTIITPAFTYSICVSLNPKDPSKVIWRREVTQITDPNVVLSDEFAAVFANTFDTIQFTAYGDIDVLALIDRIEDLNSDLITVEYEPNPAACKISLDGLDAEIVVDGSAVSLIHSQQRTPKQLLESFSRLQTMLIDTHDVRLIAFSAEKTA